MRPVKTRVRYAIGDQNDTLTVVGISDRRDACR
jgi:hypothetical protein